jgi:hypothetical protein
MQALMMLAKLFFLLLVFFLQGYYFQKLKAQIDTSRLHLLHLHSCMHDVLALTHIYYATANFQRANIPIDPLLDPR